MMNNRTFRPDKASALTATAMLLLASCSATNEPQIGAETDKAEITTTSIDWSKDQPLPVDLTELIPPPDELPGPFVGPFDGTIETLGHCIEPDYPDDVEDTEPGLIESQLNAFQAWRGVVSIDLSSAVLEPDRYLTAEEAGVRLELESLGTADGFVRPEREWVYGGELLLALADELERGRIVQVGSVNIGLVTGVSIDEVGTVRFIGNCELVKSERLQALVEQLSEARGMTMTERDMLTAIQKAGNSDPILAARDELQAGS